MTVFGVTSAELDNTGGTITGDVGIAATAIDAKTLAIKSTSNNDTATAAIDFKFATKGGTKTTTTTGSANTATKDSKSFGITATQESAGGDAV